MYREQAVEIIERHIDNNIASGSLVEQALSMAIDALKAQLSKEDTTSDLISRTEVVEHLRRMLEATVPNTDYDEGFVDGVEFGVSTVSTMPTVQPQSTAGQLNDSARSTDLINRQEALDALWKALHEYEDKTEKQFQESEDLDVRDWIEHRIFVQNMNDIDRQTILNLPSAQPERVDGEWVQIQRCTGDEQPDLECPFCKHRIGWFDMGRYCAGCGAKLKGGAG